MNPEREHTPTSATRALGDVTWVWVRFGVTCVLLTLLGYLMLVGAFLSGGHDGRGVYATGAVLTTGTLVLWAARSRLQPLRRTAAVLALLSAAFWLLELRRFLSSTGLQF